METKKFKCVCGYDTARPELLDKHIEIFGETHKRDFSEENARLKSADHISEREAERRDSELLDVPEVIRPRTWVIRAHPENVLCHPERGCEVIEELSTSGYAAVRAVCAWLKESAASETIMLNAIRQAVVDCENAQKEIPTVTDEIENIRREPILDPKASDFLDRLRYANTSRVPRFGHGDIHDTPEQGAWGPMQWGCALAGEVGELCNKLKKYERQLSTDPKADALIPEIAYEIADVLIYLDIIAEYFILDLKYVTAIKFNKTSRALGMAERVEP